jgi:putative peptidoglycan lipid II flippase
MGLNYISFTNLIAAAVSLALAEPIVRLLFEHGKFGPDATQRVALALACFAPGLLLFSMNNILARAFFALNDIKTPMKISVLCLVLNLALRGRWSGVSRSGLAVANSLSAAFNTGCCSTRCAASWRTGFHRAGAQSQHVAGSLGGGGLGGLWRVPLVGWFARA